MASLIDELIGVLNKEYEIYHELIPVAEEKTKIIVRNDVEALQQITEQEQLVVEKINVLEKRREEIVVSIATVINKRPEDLNLKAIIQILESQPKEQMALSEVRDNLNKVIKRLVEINNRNQALIQQSLEMIEFNMNFIQSARTAQSTGAIIGNNTYTKGASTGQIYGPGMFDAKQ